MPSNQRKAARCSGRHGGSMFGLRLVHCMPTPRRTPDDCFKVEGIASGFVVGGARAGLWQVVARKSLVFALSDESCEVVIRNGPRAYRILVNEPPGEVELRRCVAYARGGGE